ncbi:MAG: hypothetical protein WCQ99_03920 [Pseudomonadota bacterium]
MSSLTKEQLIKKLEELLKTGENFDFLLELKKQAIEKLVACVRERV